MLPTSAAAVTL
ncbi:hypothetical protein ACHAW6_008706 [Cyclotella cf. meneghiniana]